MDGFWQIRALTTFESGFPMFIDKKVDIAEEEAYDHFDEDEATWDTNDAARQGLGLGVLIDENPQSNFLSKAQLHEQNQTYELERERQLSEFKRDRACIISSIQGALKARRHKEAQELVF